ncbi:MAG: hypothetical protein VX528_02605, partial [Candidatus Latescibacterota bacterium]|nr:hypothetical protein [Candidatus Latescibacterota bacterium]
MLIPSQFTMPTDLQHYVQQTPLADTHEHLCKEDDWVNDGPVDVLQDLFANYVPADLISAGATPDAVARLTDPSGGTLAERFAAVEPAWQAIRHTGYGEAVHLLASEIYGLGPDWGPTELEGAQQQLMTWRQPGGRMQLMQSAGIDHTQTDDFCWPCLPDRSGP